jgi:hypothetical protein
MAEELTPNNIFKYGEALMGSNSNNDNAFGGTGFLMGLVLGKTGLFGNTGEAAAGGVTVGAINQAANDAVQSVLTAQNQAQTMQDVNRIPISVKEAQADLQHDIAAGNAALANAISQTQLGVSQGQANLINAIDSSSNNLTNQIERGNNAINSGITQTQLGIMQGQSNLINAIDSHSNEIANQIERTSNLATGQFNQIAAAIQTTGAASALAAKDAQIQGLQNTQFLAQTTTNDGEKTRTQLSAEIRSLSDKIDQNYISDLQGRLTDAKNQVTELSMEGRSAQRTRELEVNVTQNVNQNQAQLQAQAQAQYTNSLLTQLIAQQNATAGNMNILGTQNGVVQTPVNVSRV